MKGAQLVTTVILATGSYSGLMAGEVDIPNSFTSGTPAVAAEVNENFEAVKSSVNDNNARIKELEALLATIPASAVATVVSPRRKDSSLDYTTDAGKPTFTVEFNIAMDTSSFVSGFNVIASGPSGVGTGTISWKHRDSTMVYELNETYVTLAPCFSGAGVTLKILGSGSNPALDNQGKVIDGDNNGIPGGDLEISYFPWIC